jgi:hypothetical protein
MCSDHTAGDAVIEVIDDDNDDDEPVGSASGSRAHLTENLSGDKDVLDTVAEASMLPRLIAGAAAPTCASSATKPLSAPLSSTNAGGDECNMSSTTPPSMDDLMKHVGKMFAAEAMIRTTKRQRVDSSECLTVGVQESGLPLLWKAMVHHCDTTAERVQESADDVNQAALADMRRAWLDTVAAARALQDIGVGF